MTNKQINEVNGLLEEHGEALTAFYDEGIHYGMKKGASIVGLGCLIGTAATWIVYGVLKLKEKKSKKKT